MQKNILSQAPSLPFIPVLIALFFSALAIIAPAHADAASVYVQPPAAEGEDASLRTTLYELIRSSISDESGYTLSNSAKDADITLRPKLLKLGSSMIVTLDKMKGDSVIYSTKMKAATPDDLDGVASRVVRSALGETKAQENAQVGDVTEAEVNQNSRRIQTTRQWKLGFGPAWGDSMNTSQSGILFDIGFIWGIDPNFDLGLNLRGAGFDKSHESGASFSEFQIISNYYLTRARNAPYLTAGFGRTWATASIADSNTLLNTSDDKVNTWGGRVGVGYKFFRTSTVNLGIEANYSKAFGTTSRTGSSPGVTSLELALYY